MHILPRLLAFDYHRNTSHPDLIGQIV
jgi:hypothetical protein